MFEPKIITLRKPLPHGEALITELKFEREMVAGDLRGIEITRLTHDNLYEVAGRLCAVPAPVLAQLAMPDYLEVSAYVSRFFDDSPATGAKG